MNVKDVKEKIKAGYTAILPAPIRYDPNFSDKIKLLYAEITATLNHLGYCDAGNEYFGEILGVTPRSISQYVKALEDRGFIETEVVVNKRRIKLPIKQVSFLQPPSIRDTTSGIDENKQRFMDEFLKKWCDLTGARLYKPTIFYKQLLERMEEFSEEEMMEALLNRTDFVNNSEWHKEKKNRKHAKNIELLIRSDEDMLKWLQTQRDMDADEAVEKQVKSFKIDSDENLLS